MEQAHKRHYVTFHGLDTQQTLTATVVWSGTHWKVEIDDQLVPDCCDTLEEAYSVAEREITSRFPNHKCHDGCRPWEPFVDHADTA